MFAPGWGCRKVALTFANNGFQKGSEMDVYAIAKRAQELADHHIDVLRRIYAGFNCDYEPTANDVRNQTKGMTRGKLIEGILLEEIQPENE